MPALNAAAPALPLVTLVTPAYNGARHLAECIESVLAQTYPHWNYVIVNNCSTDATLEIAETYSRRDSRIRVITNEKHVWIIENHNIAFRQLDPLAKYLKPIFADDWLYPGCLEKMVAAAEAQPSVGLVGAYSFDGDKVCWQGLPAPASCVPGREICRSRLMGGPYFLGTASNLLFRADLVRQRPSFFADDHIHADYTAFLDVLASSDFAFLHEILTYCRKPEKSNSTFAKDYDSLRLGNIAALQKFGPTFLSSAELDRSMNSELRRYYRFLAKSALRFRDKDFWNYHREWRRKLGLRLNLPRLAGNIALEVAESAFRPRDALDGIRTWWFKKKQD
jgi:glycosyltransferase involved in cell wall biosynthesis